MSQRQIWAGFLVLAMLAVSCVPPSQIAQVEPAELLQEAVDPGTVRDAQARSAAGLTVLSNRADLISGGDVLVEVNTGGSTPESIDITLGGVHAVSVTPNSNGRYLALVEGLNVGLNTLSARVQDATYSIEITNSPQGGPVFAGPQIQPWKCQKTAVDAQCNEPATYRYFYRSAALGRMLPYDPAFPPIDMSVTTTQAGETVPFLVREETGYQDRSEYKIAALYRPEQTWTAAEPQSQWNHKVLVTHGGGCGVAHKSTGAPKVVEESMSVANQLILPDASNMDALGKGFVLMSTALNDAGDNCNIATQAESVMMAKEHIVERYGEIRYTIGAGCSGGALTIQQVSNAYPGIYDGLVAQCSFPDAGSAATAISDYHLLLGFFGDHLADAGLDASWSVDQLSAVLGDVSPVNALLSDAGYMQGVLPGAECDGVEPENFYNPRSNPGGVRCTLADFSINVLGPRTEDMWTDAERTLGRGYADFPIDNAGVQYGLEALQSATITPEQFLDLNGNIGGLDVDLERTPDRTVASDSVLSNSYRSGALNVGNNLAQVPIIHLVGPNPGLAHDAYRAWVMRSRLDREQGHHDNNAIWYGPIPVLGQLDFMKEGIDAIDRWLEAVEADTSGRSLADKVVTQRPSDITDSCRTSIGGGTGIFGEIIESRRQYIGIEAALENERLGPDLAAALESGSLDADWGMIIDPSKNLLCGPGASSPNFETHNWANARMVGGHGIEGDDSKCHLRSLDRSDDYGAVGFTDDQWVLLTQIFPDGVCDTSRAGVQFQPTIPWLQYGNATEVIYGGSPLSPAPVAPGWRSGLGS